MWKLYHRVYLDNANHSDYCPAIILLMCAQAIVSAVGLVLCFVAPITGFSTLAAVVATHCLAVWLCGKPSEWLEIIYIAVLRGSFDKVDEGVMLNTAPTVRLLMKPGRGIYSADGDTLYYMFTDLEVRIVKALLRGPAQDGLAKRIARGEVS